VKSFLAPNYSPLPVRLASGEGCWVTADDGSRYLDLLAGYSALNFGHRHPALVQAAKDQLDRLTLTSRAFDHELLERFARELCQLVGGSMMLPMNTGAEAVETAIKASRTWGYEVKGVPEGEATILVASGNFHGRTTTIVSFSDDDDARRGFAPHTPGFRMVPFGDAEALETAIDETTVAVLLEPIQGEAGVNVPPAGYLKAVRGACDRHEVLLVLDEIQSGLGRTGTLLAAELSGVRADLTLLGKALGGGILPVSAVVGDSKVLRLLTPGRHGSTFGGNPLACAVGLAVIDLLRRGSFVEHSRVLGAHLHARLGELVESGLLKESRGVGLWAGIDIDPARGTAREVCEALMARGILAKDTHGQTVRIAPPLVIRKAELDEALDTLTEVLQPR